MESLDNNKINKLIDYYKDDGLLIVGLNDSQGVNTTTTFFKKGLLEYLKAALTSEELNPKVIDAFSLTMNKTEHIDYFLKNNLNLEEIKLSQINSVVSALEKVMTDIGFPKFLGRVGNIYKLVYQVQKDDSNIYLSTSLKEAKEPIMIYSSGVNNLMREVGSNPFEIKKNYKERRMKPNYCYTLEKTKDKETLNKIIDSIKNNYDNVLGINSNTDIYTLGAYIPKSLQSEEMNIFRDLIIKYNDELIKLCNEYGITFVNTEEVGKKYNKSENNFHISSTGHNALANHILEIMYQNKIEDKNQVKRKEIKPIEITNEGTKGIIEAIKHDYEESIKKADELSGYASDREEEIANEHKREIEIFQKLLTKKNK